MSRPIALIGAPTSAGAFAPGQEDAPAALRAAGLVDALRAAGRDVRDRGDTPHFRWRVDHDEPRAMNAAAVVRGVREVAARVEAALRTGELVALLGLLHGIGSGYHRDLQLDKPLVFAAVDGVRGCLDMIALGLGHLELDATRCRTALIEGDAIATDLCEALVAGGMAFRDAYRSIGALVNAQRGAGRRLAQLTVSELDAHGLPHTLLQRLDVVEAARRRSRPG